MRFAWSINVVSSTDGLIDKLCTEALNRAMERGVLVQRSMGPRHIIIGGISASDPAQVRFAKHDHVVETSAADRADESLNASILPGRSGCDRMVPNAHCTDPLQEDWTIRSVSIPNEISRRTVPRERLGDLVRDPLRGWVCRHAIRHPKSSSVAHNDKTIQNLECDRRQDKEVDRRDDAARQMGLTLTNLQRLVSDGFLSYADGPEVEMCSRAKMRWKPASYIRHNEINALIESVEAKATRLKEPVRLVNGTVRMPDGAYLGLKAIIEGRITVGVDTKKLKPMQRLLVEESEFRSYVFSKVPHLADSDIISLQRAREILRLKCSVANELLEKSGVHIQRHQKKMSPKVKRFDVLRIAERYISGGDTAKLLGTLPRHVQRR